MWWLALTTSSITLNKYVRLTDLAIFTHVCFVMPTFWSHNGFKLRSTTQPLAQKPSSTSQMSLNSDSKGFQQEEMQWTATATGGQCGENIDVRSVSRGSRNDTHLCSVRRALGESDTPRSARTQRTWLGCHSRCTSSTPCQWTTSCLLLLQRKKGEEVGVKQRTRLWQRL